MISLFISNITCRFVCKTVNISLLFRVLNNFWLNRPFWKSNRVRRGVRGYSPGIFWKWACHFQHFGLLWMPFNHTLKCNFWSNIPLSCIRYTLVFHIGAGITFGRDFAIFSRFLDENRIRNVEVGEKISHQNFFFFNNHVMSF